MFLMFPVSHPVYGKHAVVVFLSISFSLKKIILNKKELNETQLHAVSREWGGKQETRETGKPKEEKMKKKMIAIELELYKELRLVSALIGVKQTELVRMALKSFLAPCPELKELSKERTAILRRLLKIAEE